MTKTMIAAALGAAALTACATVEEAAVEAVAETHRATLTGNEVVTSGGDRDGLIAAAAALEAAGCRYQWARTLVVLGGSDRVRGEDVLASMGATPMVWPPARG